MKFSPRQRVLPALIACLLSAGAAQAADETSMFSLSGFATLGLVKTDTDLAHYAMTGQPRGATEDVSAEVDSKLGVQLGAKFNPMFSATLQVLTKQNGKGNFNPKVEWAFVKAQLVPSVSVRLGRMGAPFFAVSDFRDVGFANTTVRPPHDVYAQVPVSHFDGADVTYQTATGLGTLTAQVFGGGSTDTINRTDIDLKKFLGFNVTLETDSGLSLRVGHMTGKLTVKSTQLNGLVAALRATPFKSVADQLDPNDKEAAFTGVGATWDQGEWLLNAEYTQRRMETNVPDTNAWYVTAGRRFGHWTPYMTVSQVRTVDTNVVNTIQPLNAQLAMLKGVVDATIVPVNQKTLAVGTRWDFYRNFAFKAQIDHVRPNGVGFFSRVQPGFNSRSVNVVSVAVDTVF